MLTLLTVCGCIGSGWAGAWWVCRHPEQFSRVGAGNGKRRAGDAAKRLREQVAELQTELGRQQDNHLKQITGFKNALALGAGNYNTLERKHLSAEAEIKRLTGLLGAAADEPETLALSVAEVRNAVGEAETTVMPAIPAVAPLPRLRDELPPVTWGITATRPLWEVPAGPGSSRPTELSPTTSKRAVINVADAVSEAS